jgi:hypothetical protein
MKKKKTKELDAPITKGASTVLKKEDIKENLGTPYITNDTNYSPKNTLYKYKDGSTCRVCYDSKDQNYIIVNVN